MKNDRKVTGRQILARRQLDTLAVQLRLYIRVLELIKQQWQEQNLGNLRSKLQGEVPESSLFPVWDLVAKAKTDAKYADMLTASVDQAITGISRCLEGRETTLPRDVLGKWAQTCVQYKNVFVEAGE